MGKLKLLIADESFVVTRVITEALHGLGHEIRVAQDGKEALKLISSFKPDLIFLDLTLPRVHGMEILKVLKANPESAKTGVVICSNRQLIQDYDAAIESGADEYISKSFTPKKILQITRDFERGELSPTPFGSHAGDTTPFCRRYDPELYNLDRYLKLWGTRGSIPVSGLDYIKYGGNTSCLEIHQKGLPSIILDAGSGIREVGNAIFATGRKEVHLVISHTHWDHISGFPFFGPIYQPDFTIHIYSAKGFRKSVAEIFSGMLDRDYYPVKLEEMQAQLHFHELELCEPLCVGDVKVHFNYANHPGATLCFKIETPEKSYGYATDNEFLLGYTGHPGAIFPQHPLLDPYQSFLDFFRGCETLIHEAQYMPYEYEKRVGWGHTSISNGAVLAKLLGVEEWLVTHHDPAHTDCFMREKLALQQVCLKDCQANCRVHMAYDGQIIPI